MSRLFAILKGAIASGVGNGSLVTSGRKRKQHAISDHPHQVDQGITVPKKVFCPLRNFQVPETTIFRSN
ncbi:MAG: hypothetical protein V7K32_17700 [Nostoc sp.]|uniref:hypothetical protein n=1 Tax=Nostoc sp. TaxID=1180 RepID=UPI002FFBE1F0